MSVVPYDQREGVIWLNGEFVPWSDAKVHAAEDALLDRDVLHLLDRRLLDLAREDADLPDDAPVGHDELVEVRPEAQHRERGQGDRGECGGDPEKRPANLVGRLGALRVERGDREGHGEDHEVAR